VSTPEPQSVVTPITAAAIFLVLTVNDGAEDDVRDLLADASGLKRTVGFRAPDSGLVLVTGIGARLWDRMFGAPRPADLHELPPFVGARHSALPTPGDLLFHIRANRLDLCFELAGLLTERLRGAAQVVDEVHGFKFFDERDLLGFVDGTENPEGRAALDAVVIGDEDPAFAGGSYVVVQKYVHDLDAWNALPTEEQERVIGRAKLSDVEMDDDVKPANAHIALNVIEDEDGQRQILRFNMPFGRLGTREFGTYFIGYASTAELIELMLTRMFVGDPPGNHDRILDFSTAITSNLFFVPDADFLDDPPDFGEAAADADDDAPEAAAPAPIEDPSLGLGSLRAPSA